MSATTRPLSQLNVPLIGPLDITSTPFCIVCQMADGIWILTRVTYLYNSYLGDNATEYIFTPFYGGGNVSTLGNSFQLFFMGIDINNSTSPPSFNTPTELVGVHGVTVEGEEIYFKFNKEIQPVIPTFTFNGQNLQDTETGYYAQTLIGGTLMYTLASSDPNNASNYILTSVSNPYFNMPNTYSGANYIFTFNGGIPFRFIKQFDTTLNSFLITPSSCSPDGIAPSKKASYFCNSYNTLNPFNLGRYIDFNFAGSDTLANYDPDRQFGKDYAMNFFPITGYYSSNAIFTSVSITPGNGFCTSPGQDFLNEIFYFWYSGFVNYRNTSGGTQELMTSQGTPGFVKVNTYPINITGWTNQADCQRDYYYTYCSLPNYCGDCLGSCISGATCKVNTGYTPPIPPSGSRPFTCGDPTPNPNDIKSFWDKYKWWIIGGIILLVVIIIVIVLIIVFVGKARNRENQQAEITYSADGNNPIIFNQQNDQRYLETNFIPKTSTYYSPTETYFPTENYTNTIENSEKSIPLNSNYASII